jgi:hypothetical protein
MLDLRSCAQTPFPTPAQKERSQKRARPRGAKTKETLRWALCPITGGDPGSLHVALDEPFYEPGADWTYSKMRSVVLFFGIAHERVFEKFYLGASRLSMRRMAARSMKASEVCTFNS